MAYAQGKYSRAICDRCGFDIPYLDLRKEWTGFKVCGECYEPKQPQLTPARNTTDPESLHQPRPTKLNKLFQRTNYFSKNIHELP